MGSPSPANLLRQRRVFHRGDLVKPNRSQRNPARIDSTAIRKRDFTVDLVAFIRQLVNLTANPPLLRRCRLVDDQAAPPPNVRPLL